MNKKSIILSIISVFIFSLLFWYTLVYAKAWFFNDWIKTVFKLSNNIFLDSISLNKNLIMFKSWKDLTKYKIKSNCDIYSKMKFNKDDKYLFEIKYFNNSCDDDELILVDEKWNIVYKFSFNIVKEYDVLSNLLDMKTDRLIKFKDILQSRVNKYSKYSKYNRDIDKNNYKYLRNNRLLKEAIYNLNLINNIIEKRSEKYLVPLSWHKISRELSKIPNAWRPYRADYTDGIHHWWDVDWKFWEQILAIDDWIIIRVVSDFKFSDLDKIKRWENLSDYDKLKNLDILRWNQVWLKTMKWDVIFFSHLDEIFTNIKVWTVVRKWQPIWTIWITWIPDKNYKDFHVHFAIQVNPRTKIWEYDIDDYLNWDWLFKWKSVEYILKNIDNIFED